ncbi:MAG: DNA recombination protein RmuC [Muribaculaceae bacterium]|nr:DNA recombination protein RmuC [Muribaculaceae bacterium]
MFAFTVFCAVVAVAAVVYAVVADRRATRARAEAELSRRLLEERAADTEAAEARFRAIANEALLANSQALDAAGRRSISEALAPMAERMREMEKSFREAYSAEARERFSLADRVRELVELNRVVGAETRRLTDALKGNTRVQGDWGEIILENILERSGLQQGREYEVQQTFTSPDGRRLRPDVIVNYPDGRCVVIDSKVSVAAYLSMVEADDADARNAAAKAHLASVRAHINELKSKSYQDLTAGRHCDFVMMFIPHEGAYMAAMQLDGALWQYAFDSRVLIVSPTHLMAVVKLVEQLWRNDRQSRNAMDIATEAGRMLDKLSGFLTDMEKIDTSLNAARRAWDGAYNKLATGTGNLIGRAERLRAMGAKASKDLPSRFCERED